MQHQHANAGAVDVGAKVVVAKQRHLAARAAKPFDPVRARDHQQQPRRIGLAQQRQVDRQFLAFGAALGRMHVPRNVRAGRIGGGQKLGARFAVACGEMDGRVHRADAVAFSGSAASASAAR